MNRSQYISASYNMPCVCSGCDKWLKIMMEDAKANGKRYPFICLDCAVKKGLGDVIAGSNENVVWAHDYE